MARPLSEEEKQLFQAEYDSIETISYGSHSNCCNRVKNIKKLYRINGKDYTAAQISWIVHTGCYLSPDGLDIDHICADPIWNKLCCKCITFAHLRRKPRFYNISRQNCHYAIRMFMMRLYPRIKNDPALELEYPGPVFVKDVLPYLVELHDVIHYKLNGKRRRSEEDIQKAAKKKADWIKKHEVCDHEDKCLICWGKII